MLFAWINGQWRTSFVGLEECWLNARLLPPEPMNVQEKLGNDGFLTVLELNQSISQFAESSVNGASVIAKL